MTELVTAAQMRDIEATAIASGTVTGLELMERAGAGVVDAILAEWPELNQGTPKALVFCGPGNNGGDGFVVARLLKARGWTVDVLLYGEFDRMPPDARTNFDRWLEIGPVSNLVEQNFDKTDRLTDTDVVIDALFGTGLSRAMDGPEQAFWPLYDHMPYEDMQSRSHGLRYRTVAIDIPSGVCADSGRVLMVPGQRPVSGLHVAADLTVTFHRMKLGHILPDEAATHYGGAYFSGKTAVVDIGLTEETTPVTRERTRVQVNAARLGLLNKSNTRTARPHKFAYGHALVLSGGVGRGGAARLAARGALRIGAGLVTLGCPPAAVQEHAMALDAIMVRRVDDVGRILEDDRINALCIGPGLGVSDDARTKVLAVLDVAGNRDARLSVVLDADAMSCFAGMPDTLMQHLPHADVITPHAGEFARLFPDIAEMLHAPATKGPAYSKVAATRDAAKRAGCVVVFKGPDTVIAAPDGSCSIHDAIIRRPAPWLATAGSGDVLAGFIAGLLARGLNPLAAAQTAVWLHSECAREFGPGLIAEDLPEMLPKVFRNLGL